MARARPWILCLIGLGGVLSCSSARELRCETSKLELTQQTGCQNDGSLEFCIPAKDSELLSKILKIAPKVHCAPGGGRAQCDAQRQLLCMLPTGQDECITAHQQMTPEAWQKVCELSQLPQIEKIVPTWYE